MSIVCLFVLNFLSTKSGKYLTRGYERYPFCGPKIFVQNAIIMWKKDLSGKKPLYLFLVDLRIILRELLNYYLPG